MLPPPTRDPGSTETIPSGITEQNNLGRLTEAETDTCAWPIVQSSIATDEWFNYDKNGRMTTMWEWTTHTTQYYESAAAYFPNGALQELLLASPMEYALLYTLDGEGRWNSLTDATSSQTLVSSVNYYPATNPETVNLTGTTPDNDAYLIDANTGRTDQYVFTVGNTPKTLKGVLNWSANGLLSSTATTDGFNAGGSLTCNDAYDDWGRLTQFDCGSGNWGQNYSYDIYDNLSESVISGRSGTTWSPGYPSKNQCAGCTYDSSGNQTSDGTGSNYWGWDVFDKMIWYSNSSGTPSCGSTGKCVVYDAFGRMLEYSNGSTWTTNWITPLGTSANMTGTTLNWARVPAPGGHGTVEITGTGTYNYLHNDYLGSARLVSSLTSNSVLADRAYTPYGEQFATYGGTSTYYQNFAGMTEDFNNGIQYETPNREFAIFSRWLSPDPAGTGWNQYAYATNPNKFVDPSGLNLAGPRGCNLPDGCGAPGFGGSEGTSCMDPICGDDGVDSSSECPICGGGNSSFQQDAGFLETELGAASALENTIPIFGFHSDEFGYMIGDFPGEIYCGIGNPQCAFWNPNAGQWQLPGEADVYPPLAQQTIGGHPQLWQSANNIIGLAAAPYAVPAGLMCAGTQACVATGLIISITSYDLSASFDVPEFESQPATMPLDVGHPVGEPGYEGPSSGGSAPINGGQAPPAPPLPPIP